MSIFSKISLIASILCISSVALPQSTAKRNSAGLLDSETVEFLGKFQRALQVNDRRTISQMVSYSINVNAAGKCKAIGGTTAFLRYFDQIFDSKLRDLVLDQKPENLIINSRGVGLELGAVWFAGICKDNECNSYDIRIITINGVTSCQK
jgi:hypothetical protein